MAPHILEMISCYNEILGKHRGNYSDESVAYFPPVLRTGLYTLQVTNSATKLLLKCRY